MRTIRSILLCFAVLATGTTLLSQDLHEREIALAFQADVMVNASKVVHRQHAHEQFYREFRELLDKPEARTYPFESLEWLSCVTAPDSTFRLFSWQLMLSEDQYKYFAFVVPTDTDAPVIELADKRSLRSEFAKHDQNTWYGALYYGIESFATETGELAYLVLGFNAQNARTNQKVADVLTFSDDGIQLGMPIFMPGDSSEEQEIKERIVLEYADAAAGRMQFDRERGLLVFDHVITIFTEGPDAGPLKVPDGSFHGYQYKDGVWHFVDKLFNVMVDTPPGPGIEKDKDRDIFGRPRN